LRDILAHPDGFLRHRRLSQLIRERHSSGTVLSVGDPFLELRDHLTGFDVTSTDIVEPYLPVPPGATFMQADFRAAEEHFTDHSFDLVVSTDVLEHIPSADRRQFIVQCARVARQGVFMAFPGGVHARSAEELMLRSHRHSAFRSALLDHAEHGLPEPAEVVTTLEGLGLEPQLMPLTTINEWLSSFVLDPFATAEVDLFRDYCSFLNGTVGDACTGPYYRYLVIGTKPPKEAKEALA
jgi:SAM-dependent methyltransferase